jgi:hypothetical protein
VSLNAFFAPILVHDSVLLPGTHDRIVFDTSAQYHRHLHEIPSSTVFACLTAIMAGDASSPACLEATTLVWAFLLTNCLQRYGAAATKAVFLFEHAGKECVRKTNYKKSLICINFFLFVTVRFASPNDRTRKH